MKKLIELHYLQNFAPSNLNRDDTGSPKDAIFGGHRRARISSQSYKRAMREYFNHQIEMIPEEAKALRTKRITNRLIDILKEKNIDDIAALNIVETALAGLKISIDKSKENKSQYLVFIGESEIKRIADIIFRHRELLSTGLTADVDTENEQPSTKKTVSKKEAKKDAKSAVPKEVIKELMDVLDGGKAVDLALFGRMLADLPEKSRDASCQVAHALSTHAVEREFDFYTAVDDLKPDDNAGADMLGTIEFNSACMYRYIAIDLAKFRENLQNDMDIFYKGLEAFLRASVLAIPSGKQNSFAAFNQPSFAIAAVRTDADQRNLANAFEKPVGKKDTWVTEKDKNGNEIKKEISITESSIKRFEEQWKKMNGFFGGAGNVTSWNLTDYKPEMGTSASSFDQWVADTLNNVKSLMGD